jgi:imidazole glycerol-phosphate synthase subunit HisF
MRNKTTDNHNSKVGNPPPTRGVRGGMVYGDMFEGANNLVFELAKELRRNMTDAEEKLWFHLKQGVGGFKFRRQHPLKNYIADFYCHKLKLVIEADGGIHNKPDVKEYDTIREQNLIVWGYKVIRFTNEEIIKEEEKVIRKIAEVIDDLKSK